MDLGKLFLIACLFVAFFTYTFWRLIGGLVCRRILLPTLLFVGRLRDPYHLEGYMDRYVLIKPTDWFSFGWWLRVHVTKESDHDRALHDHPGDNWSLLLENGYIEHVPLFSAEEMNAYSPAIEPTAKYHRWSGDFVRRKATDRHRLELYQAKGSTSQPCTSLFAMRCGKHKREWGFYDWVTVRGKPTFMWIHWREYAGTGGVLARRE